MTLFGFDAFTIGQTVVFALLFVLLFPWRGTTRVEVNTLLATDPATAWRALVAVTPRSDGSYHPALPETLRAWHVDPADPACSDATYEIGGRLTKLRLQTLASDPPRRHVTKLVAIDGRSPPPPGRSFDSETEFLPTAAGTEVRSVFTYEHINLLHGFLIRRRAAHAYDRAEEFFATGTVTPTSKLRARLATIGLSLSGLASFFLLFAAQGSWQEGLYLALGLAAIVLLHEFGHWLAMRLVGQRSPRFALVPFFGGIAIPSEPYRTAVDSAFVALMGPGFSALLVGIALIWCRLATGTASGAQIVFAENSTLWAVAPAATFLVLDWVAVLNLLQLLPVLPLDGGRLLQILSRAHTSWIGRLLLGGMSMAALGLAIWLRSPPIGLLALIGAFGLRAPPAVGPVMRPLSAFELTGMLAGIAATVVLLSLPLSLPGIFSRIRLADLIHDTLTQTSTIRAQPGAEGSDEIEPKFEDHARLLADLDSWHWVVGGAEAEDRSEWRTWGSLDQPPAYAQIRVTDVSQDPGEQETFGTLKRELAAHFKRDGQTVGFSDAGARLDTSLGAFGVIAFTARSEITNKDCYGFHGLPRDGTLYVAGHYCAATGAKPDLAQVRAIIDGLTFGG